MSHDQLTIRARLDRLYAVLLNDRGSFDAHWRELADYFTPRRTRWFAGDKNRGDKRNQNIINSTGRFAARTLQSGMHAGLTSPARPWMRLTLPDQTTAGMGAVKEWLQLVTQRMLTVFSITNLYNTLPTVYGDMGVFGTAAMAVLPDTKDLMRCYAYPIGSYVVAHDSRGLPSTFGREYTLSVRQVVEQFGAKPGSRDIDWSHLSTVVKTAWDRGDYETSIDVIWLVHPNEEAREDRLESRYLPVASHTWEKGSSQPMFLREGGFTSFPILVPRWDLTGEDSYGTDCPGMTALGDNRQLQIMEKRKAQAIAKMVDPPLVGPSALRAQKTSLLPGDITYIDTREGMQGLKAIHEIGLNLQHLGMDMQAVEYRIKRAFFEDLFLMLATVDPYRGSSPPTAREIDERHEEKLLALGPVLERTNDELLDPLVDRCFELMMDAGLIPPAPPEIQGQDTRPEYISILSVAQKLVGVVAQDRLMLVGMNGAPVFPGMVSKIRVGPMMDNYADMLGVDPRIIRPTEEAEQLDAANAQAAAMAQQAEVAVKAAQAAKFNSEAKLDQNSALDAIVGGAARVGAGV